MKPAPRNDEQTIRMASKLYEARDAAKVILGAEYAERMSLYQERIRNVMKNADTGEMEAAIQIATALANAGQGAASIFTLAACVEMIEPSLPLNANRTENNDG